MEGATRSASEIPYLLKEDERKKDIDIEDDLSVEEDVTGFYICKNWFSKQPFIQFPSKGYKPVFLKELNDELWSEFNREVQHYTNYHDHISWSYKFWILFPTVWFLAMLLPDLLLYYEIVVKGVGVICGLVLAAAFFVDTYYQRRLQRKKVHPMFSLLIETYKSRFLLHGYAISYEFEPTYLDGMNSYIKFRKTSAGESLESLARNDVDCSQLGFYLDEDLIGKKPYAIGVSSKLYPPRFLQGVSAESWKSFLKAIHLRSQTPWDYLLPYTIGMGSLVIVSVAA